MLKRDWIFGTVFAVLGFAPMAAVHASADCQATDAEALVARLTSFSPSVRSVETAPITAVPEEEQLVATSVPFEFKLMPAIVDADTAKWQMPAGRYWFSLEVSEAKISQNGVGIPDEDIESWLLAPADSLAVPF